MKLKTNSGEKVVIADVPLSGKGGSGKGGEGVVYVVVKPVHYRGHCAKIYHSKLRPIRQEQVEFMCAHPPPKPNSAKCVYCWPTAPLYDQGVFVGFLMPKAPSQCITLYPITQHSAKFDPAWAGLARTHRDNRPLRIKIALNLAAAVYWLQKEGVYTLLDFKPLNVMIDPQGVIYLIDLDSVYVHRGSSSFDPNCFSPDYAPPEFHTGQDRTQFVRPRYGDFSLAVVLYEVFLGIHPFMGTFKAPYHNVDELGEAIRHGLFPFGVSAQHVEVAPPLHQQFQNLPQHIQDLFKRAFDRHKVRKRPSAEDWGKALASWLGSLSNEAQSVTLQGASQSANPGQARTSGKSKVKPCSRSATKVKPARRHSLVNAAPAWWRRARRCLAWPGLAMQWLLRLGQWLWSGVIRAARRLLRLYEFACLLVARALMIAAIVWGVYWLSTDGREQWPEIRQFLGQEISAQ